MISLVLFFLVITLSAKIDAEHHLKQEYIPDHTSRFLQRASIGLLVMYFSFYKAIAFALLFWALFDAIRNVMVGQDIFYIGSTAHSDQAFRGKLKFYIATKIIALIAAIPFLQLN